MSKYHKTLKDIYGIEELAARAGLINDLHPLVKLSVTLLYIILVNSFDKYNIFGLLPMAVYPLAIFMLAELDWSQCWKRLRYVVFLVFMVGLANPFLDATPLHFGSMVVRGGIISMLTLLLKGCYTILAGYALIATTSIHEICYALDLLHVPKILITQVLLMYRYIGLLVVEVHKLAQAYAIRAPHNKGSIPVKIWGTMVGMLLLRSMERARNVFDSMQLRGFNGGYGGFGSAGGAGSRQAYGGFTLAQQPWNGGDTVYLILWLAILLTLRLLPISMLLGMQFV